jgi:hypothetical protein
MLILALRWQVLHPPSCGPGWRCSGGQYGSIFGGFCFEVTVWFLLLLLLLLLLVRPLGFLALVELDEPLVVCLPSEGMLIDKQL